ncbi:MAG: hypothetical protein ABRQ28_06800 [Smithellaceae bacterium]
MNVDQARQALYSISKSMMISRRQPPPTPGDCVAIADFHCETHLRHCGNLIFSRAYEIASLIVVARNDIATQSPAGGGQGDEAWFGKLTMNDYQL